MRRLLSIGATFLLLTSTPSFAQTLSFNAWDQGAIRVGASSLTCNSSLIGAIRYQSTGTKLQYCNGTAWTDIGGGTPAGSSTQVQYNNAGAFGGDSGLTYDATNDALTVAGKITLGAVSGLSAPASGRVPARGVSPQPGGAEMRGTQRATAGKRVGAVSLSDCRPSSCM
jgi:hypothetical protein